MYIHLKYSSLLFSSALYRSFRSICHRIFICITFYYPIHIDNIIIFSVLTITLTLLPSLLLTASHVIYILRAYTNCYVQVYATDGDDTLGGSDLDLCVYNMLKEKLTAATEGAVTLETLREVHYTAAQN